MVSLEFVHVPASNDCISPLDVCSNFLFSLSVKNIPDKGVSAHACITIGDCLHSFVARFNVRASFGVVQELIKTATASATVSPKIAVDIGCNCPQIFSYVVCLPKVSVYCVIVY